MRPPPPAPSHVHLALAILLVCPALFLATSTGVAQTSDLVFRGIPDHKIESYEDEETRYELSPMDAEESAVVIRATDEGCIWASRGNRKLTASISGSYVIFETETQSASYLKVVRGFSGPYTAPTEIGHLFLEHVSQGLNTISYRGRTAEMYQPERCLDSHKQK